ncbi:DUF6636 domain-containing protein [Brunnivagina elsteri]|uniref:Secreted protein n=1 Tax=Brunnivagina elsteri CCALA 953 TaxID=987040 RepID=A0A2A2TES2_9CYAN|nr:DUF6636 domain-containing protein [Calothrix elsteri]PAX52254.1 hypothetical protein CK510_20320 [Calothrix elsteri CCALA 953]
MKLFNLLTSVTTAVTSLVLIAVSSSTSIAQTSDSFKTPTGNIFCSMQDKYLRCDILKNSAKLPPQPKDCNLDWGNAFALEIRGKGVRACHGDTIVDPNYPVLEYGKTWKRNGFTCTSRSTGLTCTKQDKKGWQLSKTQQKFI